MIGTLVEIVVALIIVGAVFYILKLVPGDETFKQIAKVVLIAAFAIWAIMVLVNGPNFVHWGGPSVIDRD